MKKLIISENRRFLVEEDGTPFFWLGDTAWELFHKLNREEAELYLSNRAEKGFTVIQAVALAELEGVTEGNSCGKLPLRKNTKGEYDPMLPDVTIGEYDYWDHVDFIVNKAESIGLYIAMLPSWGDKFNLMWGKGPVIFDEVNARIFGEWIGNRYKDQKNLIWVLGGDRPYETDEHPKIIRAMAGGIKASGAEQLMTFHPPGGKSSSMYCHYEPWMDFNMCQTGHYSLNGDNYNHIARDYNLLPEKPTLDGEPRYEDHPIRMFPNNGFFSDYDVRQAAYWSVFAGAFGHTYGHHSIWSMNTEPGDYFIMHWKEALNRPGAYQMKHLRTLIESRPFLERIPDQDLVADERSGGDHIRATRGEGYAFFYSAAGFPVRVVMGLISGEQILAYWYDPRTGDAQLIGEYPNKGIIAFTPTPEGNNRGKGTDWVLVLDDKAKNYQWRSFEK